MKKGLRKLILSGTALAAVAATLGTSTYAWYTTNTEVYANNISGAAADAGTSSIYISADGGSTWFSKVDGDATDSSKIITSGAVTTLTPVTLINNSGAAKWVDSKGTEVTPSVLTFTLKLKAVDATAAVPVGIESIKILNTSGEAKTKENYITGATYTCDILNALAVQIDSDTTATTVSTHGYSLTPGSGCVTLKSGTAYETTYSTAVANKPNMSAHDYVNTVAGAGTVTQVVTETTALTANTKVATCAADGSAATLTFNVFLDGADVDCFDACRAQSFKFDIKFKVLETA